jgi:hypothetical protein
VHWPRLARLVVRAACVLALVGCKPSPSGTAPTAAPATTQATAPASSPGKADAPFDGSTREALTQSAARMFRKASAKVAVEVLEPLSLKLDFQGTDHHDLRVSLDRMWFVCQSDPPGCERAMNDFVAKVIHTVGVPEEPVARDGVVAMLRPRSWFESVGQAPDYEGALSDPLVGDIYAVYVVDLPKAVRSLTKADLDALGFTRAELASLARTNLTTRLGHLPDAVRNAQAGDVVVLRTGSYFESSRVLLGDDWTALSSTKARTIVVSMPANDVMIVSMDPGPIQLDKLRELTQAAFEKAQVRVSRKIYRWNAGSWAALP